VSKAIKVSREPRTTSAKAIWIKKNPTQPHAKLERSLLINLHAKLTQLFAEFSLAYHARLRPKHLCVLITLLMQLLSHCQFSATKVELKYYLVLMILATRLKMKHHWVLS